VKLPATPGFASRCTRIHLYPKGEAIFCEQATIIEINNSGAGEFVSVSQIANPEGVLIDPKEWPAMRDAIEFMIENCAEGER
jgi:hypothetical protein